MGPGLTRQRLSKTTNYQAGRLRAICPNLTEAAPAACAYKARRGDEDVCIEKDFPF